MDGYTTEAIKNFTRAGLEDNVTCPERLPSVAPLPSRLAEGAMPPSKNFVKQLAVDIGLKDLIRLITVQIALLFETKEITIRNG